MTVMLRLASVADAELIASDFWKRMAKGDLPNLRHRVPTLALLQEGVSVTTARGIDPLSNSRKMRYLAIESGGEYKGFLALTPIGQSEFKSFRLPENCEWILYYSIPDDLAETVLKSLSTFEADRSILFLPMSPQRSLIAGAIESGFLLLGEVVSLASENMFLFLDRNNCSQELRARLIKKKFIRII